MGHMRIGSGVVAVVGIVLVVVAAIVGWAVLPGYIDKKIEEEVQLKHGSSTWDKWATITRPIQMKFYIFHVTNPDDVENGALPIFDPKGPYVYDEERTKGDFLERGGSVFYRQKIQYVFNRTTSIGDEENVYNVINVAYVSFITAVSKAFAPAVPALANYLFQNGERVVKRNVSVKDLIFNGYDVSVYLENDLIASLLAGNKEFEGGRFGLYKGKNNSDDGYYQINSGVDSSSRFGEIIEWEHKTTLGYWQEDSYCDMINGTDGSIYPPFVETSRVLQIFVTDLCRSIYLTYDGETEVQGVKGYRFTIPTDMLEDPRSNEDNACFCMETNETLCGYSGVLDVGTCRGGAPIVMSTPYFLDGDSDYQSKTNLTPNRDLHQTVMILEPNTGVLLGASKRIQVNLKLQPFPTSPIFANLTEMFFPIIWVDESVDIDAASVEELEDKLLKPIKTVTIAKWTVLGVGILLSAVGAISFFVFK